MGKRPAVRARDALALSRSETPRQYCIDNGAYPRNKGYVGHEPAGGSFRYHAIASQDDFAGRSLAQVIKSYFRGSASAAVSALVKDEKISIDELRQIIDMVEQHKND